MISSSTDQGEARGESTMPSEAPQKTLVQPLCTIACAKAQIRREYRPSGKSFTPQRDSLLHLVSFGSDRLRAVRRCNSLYQLSPHCGPIMMWCLNLGRCLPGSPIYMSENPAQDLRARARR